MVFVDAALLNRIYIYVSLVDLCAVDILGLNLALLIIDPLFSLIYRELIKGLWLDLLLESRRPVSIFYCSIICI